MDAQRAPRQIAAPEAAPSVAARRLLYAQAMRASTLLREPEGQVALVLLEVLPIAASAAQDERVCGAVATRLADLFNRRLRSTDLLVRSGTNELAVLLTLAHIGVAAGFSERMRQPIEQALRGMRVADEVAVCMGLAANPPAGPWHPDALIELADFRVRQAMRQAREARSRDWALVVECAAMPEAWSEPEAWPATTDTRSDAGF